MNDYLLIMLFLNKICKKDFINTICLVKHVLVYSVSKKMLLDAALNQNMVSLSANFVG